MSGGICRVFLGVVKMVCAAGEAGYLMQDWGMVSSCGCLLLIARLPALEGKERKVSCVLCGSLPARKP